MFFFPILLPLLTLSFFFFNDTATTEIYTLSLHDALPISAKAEIAPPSSEPSRAGIQPVTSFHPRVTRLRSEEHTSELQSHLNLVCRLLLEKKKKRSLLEDKDNTLKKKQLSVYSPIGPLRD